MIRVKSLEDNNFNVQVSAEEIASLIPTTLKVNHNYGYYGYDLIDCIGFLREGGFLTLALDFKIDLEGSKSPDSHYDPESIFPKSFKDVHVNLERSMVLTAFVTINVRMPNKGIKSDGSILLFDHEPEIYTTLPDHPKGPSFNVSKASCVRLNRLGQFINVVFCRGYREKFMLEDGMVTDMVKLYPKQREDSIAFINEFLKSGITYNRGIYIGKDKEGKRDTTSIIDLDSPMVNTNLHILNNFYPYTLEPELFFPYFGRQDVWDKYDEIDSIYRLGIDVYPND